MELLLKGKLLMTFITHCMSDRSLRDNQSKHVFIKCYHLAYTLPGIHRNQTD